MTDDQRQPFVPVGRVGCWYKMTPQPFVSPLLDMPTVNSMCFFFLGVAVNSLLNLLLKPTMPLARVKLSGTVHRIPVSEKVSGGCNCSALVEEALLPLNPTQSTLREAFHVGKFVPTRSTFSYAGPAMADCNLSMATDESLRSWMPSTTYPPSFKLDLPEIVQAHSSFKLATSFGMNFATARNICLEPDLKSSFILFAESGSIVDIDRAKRRRSGFNWGYQFKVVKGSIPTSALRVHGITVIISPAYIKHVTHFAESSIPLWHALANPDRYPVHSNAERILLRRTTLGDDLEWNRKLLHFLAHRAGISSITDPQSLSRQNGNPSLVCFEKAGLVGMGIHEFGFFANEVEAQAFRRHLFTFYSVPVINDSALHRKSRCLVLQRKGSRKLSNRAQVVSSLEKMGLYDCSGWNDVLHGEMERVSFERQLLLVASAQFLVGLHGSGLVNSIFLSPHSVVLDLLPHNYLELEWHNFASKAGIRFYFMFLSKPARPQCLNPCTGNIFQTSKVACRAPMQCDHSLEDFKLLEVIAAQADFHIRVSPNVRHMNSSQHLVYSGGPGKGDPALEPPIGVQAHELS